MKEAFLQSWGLLTFAAKRKVLITTCLTILLSGLDFIAVALIGLVGALAIRGIQSQGIGDRTNQVLSILDLQDLTLSVQIIVLGLAAFFMLILRSVITYFFTRRIFLFMSHQSTELASLLLSKILSKPVDYVQRKSSQEYMFHINVGTGHLMMGVIGNAFTIISDLALFLMLVVLLLVADFQSALVTALIFVLIGLMLNTIMQKRAISLGNEAKKSAIYINEAISELFTSLREIRTKNTTKIYEERVKRGRAEIIRIAADQKMMPIFSKYVIEISIFTLFLVIAAIQFTFNDTARAVGNLALFFAASTRMSPAVLRMQQNFIQMKGAIGGGKGTLELLKIEHIKDSNAISNFKSGDFTPSVNFEWVSFSYGEDQDWRLGPLNFQVPPLSFVAFVGGSGAGKSTIIDLIFGLLKPQEGNVTISGRPASVALKTWPGKFGYVPQNVAIHKGTVLSNLLLGMEENEENIQSSLEALQLVGLGETSGNPKFGLKTELDERGSNLSGGQRQRLGIARAIVSKPELLILDESTSSLDAISESLITESLDILRGKLTIIVIAHRLSTVKKADILYYVERGKILAEGDFNSLRRKVPDFDLQSKLMGM